MTRLERIRKLRKQIEDQRIDPDKALEKLDLLLEEIEIELTNESKGE